MWLILRPAWLRFVVWGFFLAVGWGGLTTLQTRHETESTILSAICFAAITAGLFTVTTQATHRKALEALSGLDQAGRSQAIDAVSHGVVPADPDVRASAIRLGRVALRNKSADELKRTERWTWVAVGFVTVLAIVAVAANFANERLFYVGIAVLSAIALLSLVRTRRFERNVERLAEGVS